MIVTFFVYHNFYCIIPLVVLSSMKLIFFPINSRFSCSANILIPFLLLAALFDLSCSTHSLHFHYCAIYSFQSIFSTIISFLNSMQFNTRRFYKSDFTSFPLISIFCCPILTILPFSMLYLCQVFSVYSLFFAFDSM